MSRQLIILLFLLLGNGTVAQQQNLIFNGSFEVFAVNSQGDTICPQGGGQLPATEGWHSLLSAADYLHTCSSSIFASVPQNRLGFQYPQDGDGYVSIGGYRPWASDMREFLWIELPEPLKAGFGYEFEGRVSLCDSMNFAMAGFGAWFTTHDMWDYSDRDSLIGRQPQVINPYANLLDDKENWMKVGGYFVAEGGEKFMTVGFFRKDEDDNIQRVSNHPEATYNWEGAGYYVDGLALYEVSGVGVGEQLSMGNEQLAIWPNPTTGILLVNTTGYEKGGLDWSATDLSGKRLLTGRLYGSSINLSSLEGGTYLILFSQQGRMEHSEKVVLIK